MRIREWRPKGLFVLAVSLLLAACGGGGGSGGGGGGDILPPDEKATSLAAQQSFTDDDIVHFLKRTHFGVKPDEFDAVKQMGIPAYVDAMLARQLDETFDQSMLDAEVPANDQASPSAEQFERWWLRIMMNTDDPFREVLAMFWHDHFATGITILDGNERYWWYDHMRLLRTGGYGNFREFLFNMSIDWTMLDWLDGRRSRAGDINENFAREFWELFTLGEGNGYTQQDIEEAARCFTGYDDFTDENDNDLRKVRYEEDRHDTGDKIIFGMTVPGRSGADAWMEYYDVIDLTFQNRPVAEFIVTKLWNYFAYENPPQELIDGLALVFRNNNYELAPLMAAMFKSEAFYSVPAKAGIMKSPVDYGVGFIRSTGLILRPSQLEDNLTASGQRPTRPPNVAGWEQGDLWFSAQYAVERANMIQDCIEDRNRQADAGVDVRDLLPEGADAQTPPTPEEIVDGLSQLLDVELTDELRTTLITYLNTDRENDGTIVDDAFDPANNTHIDERVRGLLYILSQHPTYHVR